MPQQDSVDRHIEHWIKEVPDLDPLVEGVITRMQLIVKHLRQQRQATIEARQLEDYEYETLHMLGGCGPDHSATPTEIATWLHVSPAAITGRLDALERRGFVRRRPSPDDRRKVIVQLTAAGRRIWRAGLGEVGAEEAKLLGALDHDEQVQLSALLRRMLLLVDRPELLRTPKDTVRQAARSRSRGGSRAGSAGGRKGATAG
jgi:DNA-binding MarR family transcriptional regulator